jgi:hypothetical protein
MDERIAEIRERAEKATREPWRVGDDRNDFYLPIVGADGLLIGEASTLRDEAWANAHFLVNARSDIPHLLDSLAAAQRERDEAREALRKVKEVAVHRVGDMSFCLYCRVSLDEVPKRECYPACPFSVLSRQTAKP